MYQDSHRNSLSCLTSWIPTSRTSLTPLAMDNNDNPADLSPQQRDSIGLPSLLANTSSVQGRHAYLQPVTRLDHSSHVTTMLGLIRLDVVKRAVLC
ncbi:hypothetical protein BaRGS_00023110 [Batillaria attramentaria]|uniref:Uncharacterized protein n=1 Tax=Batillaria attramentaria TaxID=370345 RepID=A0ABD0KF45_9CAEN